MDLVKQNINPTEIPPDSYGEGLNDKQKTHEIEQVVIDTHWDDYNLRDSIWPLKNKL